MTYRELCSVASNSDKSQLADLRLARINSYLMSGLQTGHKRSRIDTAGNSNREHDGTGARSLNDDR